MASSDKRRISVLLVFFVILIVFGILYRPMDSSGRIGGNPELAAHPAAVTNEK